MIPDACHNVFIQPGAVLDFPRYRAYIFTFKNGPRWHLHETVPEAGPDSLNEFRVALAPTKSTCTPLSGIVESAVALEEMGTNLINQRTSSSCQILALRAVIYTPLVFYTLTSMDPNIQTNFCNRNIYVSSYFVKGC